jgi:hypothetical protein
MVTLSPSSAIVPLGHDGDAVCEAGYTCIVVLRFALKLAVCYDPVIGRVLCLGPLARLGTISYGIWLMRPAILWLTRIGGYGAASSDRIDDGSPS